MKQQPGMSLLDQLLGIPPQTVAAAPSPRTPQSAGRSLLSKILQASLDSKNDDAPHVIVEARAGTGKTTTLIEGLKLLKGLPTSIQPSPQQRAVWDSIMLSKGKATSVMFCAFNRSIAEELKARVPFGCEACTMHSFGFRTVQAALGRMEVSNFLVQDRIATLLGRDVREIRRRDSVLLRATERMVELCKMHLVDASGPDAMDALTDLAVHHEVDMEGRQGEVLRLVPMVLELCLEPRGVIDKADMIWLPVAKHLPIARRDLLLVDEAQDLNRCQQALARRAGRRLILVGDPKQAIYGFAGADSKSMERMQEELSADPRGCVVLPMTVTRRCGRTIVEEARKIVPEFHAHESNPDGAILYARYPDRGVDDSKTYLSMVEDGDLVLCRVNAPLVSQCFRFLQAGRKANIQGRDIAQGLISTVEGSKAETTLHLIAWLDEWLAKEQAKEQARKYPSEARMIALADRRDCLLCFCEGTSATAEVLSKIDRIFTDSKDKDGICLSSVHRAKGLEAETVFLLQPKGASMPHPMAKSEWQVEQEWNLRYVAITRAIRKLVHVTSQ